MRVRHALIGMFCAAIAPFTVSGAAADHPLAGQSYTMYTHDPQAKLWGSAGYMNRDVDWYFEDTTVPAGGWRDRIAEAAAKWNAPELPLYARYIPHLTTTGMTVQWDVDQECDDYDADHEYKPGGHYYQQDVIGLVPSLPDGHFAETRMCGRVEDNYMYNFKTRVSTGFTWSFAAQGGTVGNTELDLLGVLTHEFGHGMGLKDFNLVGQPTASGLCPAVPGDPVTANWAGNNTMCQGTLAGQQWKRSLGSHDISIFDSFTGYNNS